FPLALLANPRLDALASAYIEGQLDIQGPLPDVIALADQLSAALGGEEVEAAEPRVAHDRQTDAEAIAYHYDLSNDFYALWLDPEMVYSCAYCPTGTEDLASAQRAKLDHLCRKLRLREGEHLLDVGCGWGGLARF